MVIQTTDYIFGKYLRGIVTFWSS